MKTKIIAFDWDGVLYDSVERYIGHFNTIIAQFGITPLSLEEYRAMNATTTREALRLVGVPEQDILPMRDRYLELTREEPRPCLFADVPDTLRWLSDRAIAVHIISGYPAEDIRDILLQEDLLRYVATIEGGRSPREKAASLAALLSASGATREELVFVDDSSAALAFAREIGCHRVGSARGFDSYERLLGARPDRIIHNLKNLQGFINFLHYRHC